MYGCRHSLIDGLNRATDVMIGGKVAVVLRLRRRGQGLLRSPCAGQGARVIVTEIDPICALQAAMDGYQVATLEDVVATADIFITATGNYDIITAEHMAQMKHKAIVGNIGHFDNEIDMAGLKQAPGIKQDQHQAAVRQWAFADGHASSILSEGRLLNLGCATGHPSLCDVDSRSPTRRSPRSSCSPSPRVPEGVYTLPKHLDEKVARLHLDALGREAHRAHQGAGRLHRRAGGRPLQVPTTTATEPHASCVATSRWVVATGCDPSRCFRIEGGATLQRSLD